MQKNSLPALNDSSCDSHTGGDLQRFQNEPQSWTIQNEVKKINKKGNHVSNGNNTVWQSGYQSLKDLYTATLAI